MPFLEYSPFSEIPRTNLKSSPLFFWKRKSPDSPLLAIRKLKPWITTDKWCGPSKHIIRSDARVSQKKKSDTIPRYFTGSFVSHVFLLFIFYFFNCYFLLLVKFFLTFYNQKLKVTFYNYHVKYNALYLIRI